MADPADIQRLIGDLAQEGLVRSVDLRARTCRVAIGDLAIDDVPWLATRAGKTRSWNAPSIGEQVLLLCPEGDLARAVVLGSIPSDANPVPFDDGSAGTIYPDGARIMYDPDTHVLDVALPAGATIVVTAPGGVKLDADLHVTGDIRVDGRVTAADDVVAAGKSLKSHRHLGVQPGQGVSGTPQ